MAIYRSVHLSFWTDTKVTDDFTPEDKYFYLYLLTNPHTNLCGCYEISVRQISREMGYAEEAIEGLIKRFSEVHKNICYDRENKEILILNWSKYNWTKSSKFIGAMEKEVDSIKTKDFREYLREKIYGIDTVYSLEKYGMDTVSKPERYPMDTPVTVTVSVTDTVSDSVTDTDKEKEDKDIYKEERKRIIEYLNNKLNTRYKYNTANTVKQINARFREGYSEEDFYSVIDKKCAEWTGTEYERFLCPDTLFGTKFEKYMNQRIVEGRKSYTETIQDRISEVDNW